MNCRKYEKKGTRHNELATPCGDGLRAPNRELIVVDRFVDDYLGPACANKVQDGSYLQ